MAVSVFLGLLGLEFRKMLKLLPTESLELLLGWWLDVLGRGSTIEQQVCLVCGKGSGQSGCFE